MLREDHSAYCWLLACADTTAQKAASAIVDWSAAFHVPQRLTSHGPTHFLNETVRLVCKGLYAQHHFTLPYTRWSNGGAERFGKDLLREFRSIASEFRIRAAEWPDLLPFVKSVLINTHSAQRAGISPVKAFTGLDATPPIATIYRSSFSATVSMSDADRERILNCRHLCRVLTDLRPVVQSTLQKHRERQRK